MSLPTYKTFNINFIIILSFIILIEGFVSVAIEILAIRQLLPVAGGSVIVTSLIIGIFLLFLALGYRRGGRITENFTARLRVNFLIAATATGIGLSYLFIFLFFYYTQQLTGPHIIYPLTAYLLLVIAPIIYILGQTIPITMNLARQNKSIGAIGGDTLGLSTIGSFLGATITALVFMQYLGVAITVIINVGLLLLLAIFLSENKSAVFFTLLFSAIILWFTAELNIRAEILNFVRTNNYANYQILNRQNANLPPGEKILVINNLLSSRIDQQQKGFPYVERIKQILFHEMKIKQADILVLGAGGFTLSAENTFDNHFTYVDIDNNINKIVVPNFIKKINGTFVGDDARHYLQSTTKQYQVIIVDAYSNLKSVPAQLSTREYMQDIQKRLLSNGVVIFNVIASPSLADTYSKRMDNTIRDTFKNCMVEPENYSHPITNILYICFNRANQIERLVYTDNSNTVTTDSFEW
jgi:predicted membrane-bound spermidine synthase